MSTTRQAPVFEHRHIDEKKLDKAEMAMIKNLLPDAQQSTILSNNGRAFSKTKRVCMQLQESIGWQTLLRSWQSDRLQICAREMSL